MGKFDWFAWISHRTLGNIVNGLDWLFIIRFKFNQIMFGMANKDWRLTMTNLNISHDEFFKINNVLREYNKLEEEIKNIKT